MSSLEYSTIIAEPLLQDIIDKVRPLTMVTPEGLGLSVRAALTAVKEEKKGPIVECGVWRGGCSIAMLLAQRAVFGQIVKPVYMLDSFEGLPDVEAIDGPLAKEYQDNRFTEENHQNCLAGLDEVKANLARFELSDADAIPVKGWYNETVPPFATKMSGEGIAVLRLDCDWYDSVMCCLDHLEPLVVEDGTVIIDDYYSWDGCAVALHEYMGRHKMPYRLRTTGCQMGVYFQKAHRSSMTEL